MPSNELLAGALSLVLIHCETGCRHSGLNAARLLDRLVDTDQMDDELRLLCDRASQRLAQPETAPPHAAQPPIRVPAAHPR